MKVIFQKADLDTCLTAIICGVGEEDQWVVAGDHASETDLADPLVLCIETGGSGQTHLNNFDHHDPLRYFQPACRQAAIHYAVTESGLLRLVDYVCRVDEAIPIEPPIAYPTLSNLFSGMRSVWVAPKEQFRHGQDLLCQFLLRELDPFQPLAGVEFWKPYLIEQRANSALLEKDMAGAVFFITGKGFKVGFLRTKAPGALGALYQRGCHFALAHNPEADKYTIAGKNLPVSGLLPWLKDLEYGWGGRAAIIGSPAHGSKLNVPSILKLIRKVL